MAKCKNCKYLDTVQNDLRSEPFKWCVCTDDSPVLDMERDCENYAPMTNADRICSMSDEKLAELLDSVDNGGIRALDIDYPCDECTQKTECEDCFKEWLQSEVEE